MKDWGYEPENCWSLHPPNSGGVAAPVFHVYRVLLQQLTVATALLVRAVRTPFTWLLDAAETVWVLGCPVTSWGHRQTGKRYHRRPECGKNYTPAGLFHAMTRQRVPDSVAEWCVGCVKNEPQSGPVRRCARIFVRSVARQSGWSKSAALKTAAIWNQLIVIPQPSSSGRSIRTLGC